MSSTKRGRTRNSNDFYATPSWVVDRLLERVALPRGRWLEPGAGEGDLILAVHRTYPSINWTAVELREECRPKLEPLVGELFIQDFQSFSPIYRFDVAIGNPPFSLAMNFIQKSMELADHVVMLLRLNYMGSEERHGFFKKNPPNIYVLPQRPSFTENRKTDSSEYAWFHWNIASPNKVGKIELLDLTPLSVRKPKRVPVPEPISPKRIKALAKEGLELRRAAEAKLAPMRHHDCDCMSCLPPTY